MVRSLHILKLGGGTGLQYTVNACIVYLNLVQQTLKIIFQSCVYM